MSVRKVVVFVLFSLVCRADESRNDSGNEKANAISSGSIDSLIEEAVSANTGNPAVSPQIAEFAQIHAVMFGSRVRKHYLSLESDAKRLEGIVAYFEIGLLRIGNTTAHTILYIFKDAEGFSGEGRKDGLLTLTLNSKLFGNKKEFHQLYEDIGKYEFPESKVLVRFRFHRETEVLESWSIGVAVPPEERKPEVEFVRPGQGKTPFRERK